MGAISVFGTVQLVDGLISVLIFGPFNGVGQGLYHVMFGGLVGGGIACLQHFALRVSSFIAWDISPGTILAF